jgi:hypothetical protein
MREFYSPGGRRWAATLFYVPSGPRGLFVFPVLASTSVLRFKSDDITLDLADWPDDWTALPDAALVSLLQSARIPSFLPLRSRYEMEKDERAAASHSA